MLQLPESDIDRIEIATTDGERVAGGLARWNNGVYRLSTSQGLVDIRNGEIISVAAEETEGPEEQPAVPGSASETTAPPPAAPRTRKYNRSGHRPTM